MLAPEIIERIIHALPIDCLIPDCDAKTNIANEYDHLRTCEFRTELCYGCNVQYYVQSNHLNSCVIMRERVVGMMNMIILFIWYGFGLNR